jgi:hypothetical protein
MVYKCARSGDSDSDSDEDELDYYMEKNASLY